MLLKTNSPLDLLNYLADLKTGIRKEESGRLDGACCEATVDVIEDKVRELFGYRPRKGG